MFSPYLLQTAKMSTSTGSDLALGDAPSLSSSGKAALCPLQLLFTFPAFGCYQLAPCRIDNPLFGRLRSNRHAITNVPLVTETCQLLWRIAVQSTCQCKCAATYAGVAHIHHHIPLSLPFTEERAQLREEMDRMWLANASSSRN